MTLATRCTERFMLTEHGVRANATEQYVRHY
jgi:hypothetical protein